MASCDWTSRRGGFEEARERQTQRQMRLGELRLGETAAHQDASAQLRPGEAVEDRRAGFPPYERLEQALARDVALLECQSFVARCQAVERVLLVCSKKRGRDCFEVRLRPGGQRRDELSL